MDNTTKSKFQYTTPRIVQFNYAANMNAGEGTWNVKMQHEKKIVKIDDNTAQVIVVMAITLADEDSPFDIDFAAEAKFKWENMGTDQVSNFLSRTAVSLIIGHVRPLVAMFTNSSGFTPFQLPLLDFTQEPIVDFGSL